MTISFNSFWCDFWSGSVLMRGCHCNEYIESWETENCILNLNCTIILSIIRVKYTIENAECIFHKTGQNCLNYSH